ncbi:MAG: response regulator [bacterium]
MKPGLYTILIVDDSPHDQSDVKLLIERSLSSLTNVFLSIVSVSSFIDARTSLATQQFNIITLDGGMGVDFGYDLIPFIHESQTQSPIIIMISGEGCHIRKGLHKGAHFGFCKRAIQSPIVFNEKFELVPIVSQAI